MVKEILRKSIQIAELKGGDKTLRDSVIRYKKHVENLSYQEMNNVYYYLSTLALFAIEAFLAIVVNDIGTIFNFLSAFTVTFLGFWFPAFFFIYAEKKFPNE